MVGNKLWDETNATTMYQAEERVGGQKTVNCESKIVVLEKLLDIEWRVVRTPATD